MECSALCFVSFWLVADSRENVTQVQGVVKVLSKLLLGKFLIGAEILLGFDIFLRELWWDCPFVCCCGSTGKIKTCTTVHLFGKILPCTWWRERMHTFPTSLLLHKWKSLCGAVWLSVWHDFCRNSAGTQCEIRLLLYRQTWQKSSSGLFLSSRTQMQEWLHHFQCVFQIQIQLWPHDWTNASYLKWTSPEYFEELLRRRKSFLLRIFLN